MAIDSKQIEILVKKLAELQSRQALLEWDIQLLATTIRKLQAESEPDAEAMPEVIKTPVVEASPALEEWVPSFKKEAIAKEVPSEPSSTFNLERFIGENLSNKVGAFITVLGVGIGVKFAIDNNLIGPLTRILLGYAVALGMLVFSYRFRQVYKDLSTVLLSGAVCIAYFTTYAAYDYYHLITLPVAFMVLLAITGYTIWEAMRQDQPIIALGGMVGAYWIPTILGGQANTPVVVLSYIALINLGLLYIAFRKQWDWIIYLAFIVSWGNMLNLGFSRIEHKTALLFLNILYFGTFIGMYSAQRWLQKHVHTAPDSVYLILNGVVFAIMGLMSLPSRHLEDWMSAWLAGNSLFYFGYSYALFRSFGQERPFGLVSRGAVVCLLLAMLLKADILSEWMVVLSAVMVFSFGFGRRFRLYAYQQMIVPLSVVGILALLEVYNTGYGQETKVFSVLINVYSMAFAAFALALFAVVQILLRIPAESGSSYSIESRVPAIKVMLLVVLGGTLYFYGLGEIWHYYDAKLQVTKQNGYYSWDIFSFKIVHSLNYTLLFAAALNVLGMRFKVESGSRNVLATLSMLSILAFLVIGLYTLGYLKNCYINPPDTLYTRTGWHLGIRYVSISILGLLCFSLWKLIRAADAPRLVVMNHILPLFIHGVALWVVSSELVHWMEMNGMGSRSYKVALSILFGCWSVLLIVLGIRQNYPPFRVGAIVLFSATLVKLFVYDLSQISTISKTIVLISLGILLLLISYLYNRFKEKFL